MKINNSKLVNRFVSKSRQIKNKLTGHHGHQEFTNDETDLADSKLSSKVLFIKSHLTSVYKPLSE